MKYWIIYSSICPILEQKRFMKYLMIYLSKHLGYQGFKELKYAIDQSIHVEEQEGNSRSFQTITNQITSNVTETFHQMSEEKAKQMMTLIHQSNTI